MLRPLLVLSLIATAGIAHAQSAPPRAAAAPAQTLVVPFDPPLDTPIRLVIDRTRDFASATAAPQRVTAGSEEEIVFTRKTAEGYTLKWRSLSARAATPEATQIVSVMSAGLRRTPVEVRLDRSGKPIAISNWPSVQAELRSISAELKQGIDARVARLPAEQRDRASATLSGAADSLASFTSEQALAQLLREVTPLIGWGGTRLSSGQAASAPTTVRAEIIQLDLPATRATRLVRTTPGRAVDLSVVTRPAAGAINAAVDAQIARALPSVPEADKARARTQLESFKRLSVEERTSLTLDLPGGVPRAARITRVTTVPGVGTQTDTSVVTRR